MKKSSMVEIMVNASKTFYYGTDKSEHTPENLMTYVLEQMEKEGLEPPRYIPKDIGYVWDDKPCNEPNGYNISVSKWTPEDEDEEK